MKQLFKISLVLFIVFAHFMPVLAADPGSDNDQAVRYNYPYYATGCSAPTTDTAPAGSVATPGSANYIAIGNIPKGGVQYGASIFGGSYHSDGNWYIENQDQVNKINSGKKKLADYNAKLGNPGDDNGTGPLGPSDGKAVIAELNNGSALGSIPLGTKLEITYKGKTIIAEKNQIGGGGGDVQGKTRAVDLWWEAARLLDFKDGEGIVTVHAVDKNTPTTPVDGQAANGGNTAGAVSGNCVCVVKSATNLNGNDNVEKAFNYFVQKGLTPIQSAAIVGNMMQESHVSTNDTNPSSGAFGIAQWTQGRKAALQNFAKDQNKPVTDLGVQLDYLWKEVSPGGSESTSLEKLKSETDLTSAVTNWETNFERAGVAEANIPARVKFAQDILNNFGGSTAGLGGNAIATDTSGNCSDVTGSGQNTKYIDGFTVYAQYDPAWKDKAYSSSTIGASGCAPSAMAMIITALTGKRVTPAQTAPYAASKGMYIPGQGSSWDIAPTLAAHWNLKAEPLKPTVSNVTKALQEGKLVIGAGEGPKPWTSGGHYLVIRGVTSDGKFKIGDSGHNDTSNKEWDPEQLLSNINDGSVYAISK